MADSGSKVTIVVALIGVVGTIGAALLGNWDKIFGRASEPAAASPEPVSAGKAIAPVQAEPAAATNPVVRAEPRPSNPPDETVPNRAAAIIELGGLWHDTQMPGNVARIVQDGERFQFENAGITEQGIGYRSIGTGTISGTSVRTSYTTQYQNGATTRGACSGSVSSDGAQMMLTCSDPLSGTFAMSARRQ